MVEQDSMDDQSIQIAKDCQGLPDLAKDCQGNPKQIFSVPWRVEGKPSRGPCVCPGPGPPGTRQVHFHLYALPWGGPPGPGPCLCPRGGPSTLASALSDIANPQQGQGPQGAETKAPQGPPRGVFEGVIIFCLCVADQDYF